MSPLEFFTQLKFPGWCGLFFLFLFFIVVVVVIFLLFCLVGFVCFFGFVVCLFIFVLSSQPELSRQYYTAIYY